jgi:cytochrome c
LESSHPGARLFRKCANCHSVTNDGVRRSGPHFSGLFGRRAGTVPGYKYSRVLRGADFVWNEITLYSLFDKGPDVFLPGTKMPLQRIPHDAELRQLIDYLRELTTSGSPDGAAGGTKKMRR